MWNWSVEASVETIAKPEAIWKLWSSVEAWPQWDDSLEWSKLSGNFETGAKGALKPKDWATTPFEITLTKKPFEFNCRTRMPLTQMVFTHTIKPLPNNKYLVTHGATVSGLLAPLLKINLYKKLQVGLPAAVEALVKLAEKESQ